MDELGHDERLRRLQRLAYGAVASDAERAAAVAEIEALRREREREQPVLDEDSDSALNATDAAATRRPGLAPALEAPMATLPSTPNRYRWTVAVGTAALVTGIVVGWQIGLRMHELNGEHPGYVGTPDVRLAAGTPVPVPIDAAPASEVFDRAPAAGDRPTGLDQDHLLDDSYRLLSTRSDGVRIYAARTSDAENVCVVLTLPTVETPSGGVVPGGAGSACTHDGFFPGEGLTFGLSGQGRETISVSWRLDGSVSVSPADSLAPVVPNAAG